MTGTAKAIKSIPFPYSVAEFDKDGILLSTPTVPDSITDLLVISHGWNNTKAEAEELYQKLLINLADVTKDDLSFSERRLAVIGVIWPAKKFSDDFMGKVSAHAGGAAAQGGSNDFDANQAVMMAAVERLTVLYPDAGEIVDGLMNTLPRIEESEAEQEKFVQGLRKLLVPEEQGDGFQSGSSATNTDPAGEDGVELFFRGNSVNIFDNAGRPDIGGSLNVEGSTEIGTGRAAGLGKLLSKGAKAVNDLVNLTSYYEMKKRAGTIGAHGLAPLLDQLSTTVARIHLVGHSFGGRLVTAAAANSTTTKLYSMSLLQAAFSHNGFSRSMQGFFRSVIDAQRIAGPILITHTKNDKAVSVAYPIASRIGNQVADTFGGPDDKYGGLGSNGAVQMEHGEVFTSTAKLLPSKGQYEWAPGKLHNLESSDFIRDPQNGDAHGWVFVPEVAWAISRAVVA